MHLLGVQAGLAWAEDALTRKRARYLLQRAVEVSAEQGADYACAPGEETGTEPPPSHPLTIPTWFPGREVPRFRQPAPGVVSVISREFG